MEAHQQVIWAPVCQRQEPLEKQHKQWVQVSPTRVPDWTGPSPCVLPRILDPSVTAQRSTWSSLGLPLPLLKWDLVTSLHPHTAPSKIHDEGCSQPLLCTWVQGCPLEFLLLLWQVVKCWVCGCAWAHTCTAHPQSGEEQVAPPGPQAICLAPGTHCSSLASSINLQLTSQTGPAMQTSDRSLLPFRPQRALIPCLSQPSEGSPCIHPCPWWVRRGQAGLPTKPRGLNPGSLIPPPYWHQVWGPGAAEWG